MGVFSLIGGLIQKRPDVPEFQKVNAQGEQQKAIEGNIAAFDSASQLANKVNSLNQEQLMSQLRASTPRYDELMKRGSDIVAEFSAPGIPKDLQGLIQRKSAAKALSGGYAGSQAATNLELRDLGLTGLELAGKRMSAIESWLGFARQAATAPTMDVTSMFLSPQQQIGLAVSERDKQFNRDWSNSVNRANNAWETVLGKEMQNSEAQMMSMVTSVLGSLGGAAGGAAMCWVAREVYGESNPAWLQFRAWITTKAPKWILGLYRVFGPYVAKILRKFPSLKPPVKAWMDSKIQAYGYS